MSLLKRLEHGGAAPIAPVAPPPGDPSPFPSAPVAPEPTFRPNPIQTQVTEAQRSLKERVKRKLISELDPSVDSNEIDEVRHRLKSLFDQIIEAENLVLTRAEKERLFEELAADVIGFGPIEPLLNDPSVSEVMVNGPRKVYFERKGRLQLSEVQFDDDEHVRRIIDRIVSPLGRHVDEASPIVDARLPDGSRVNVVIPPISLVGPTITIRKFTKEKLRVDDLIRFGSITPEIADFLRACVHARLNVVISGGTGSGKTTLLNVLSNFIPDDERIVSIEDSAELQLAKEHWIRLETRPANIEGSGAITARDCMKATLRMRPDRVIVGECRGGEALDMLQAMNTGHDGSLTTGHAKISAAVDVIVQQSRMRDGSRKVTHITEVQGMEGDKITLQDVFLFEQEAYENGKVIGSIKPTGVRPKLMPKIEEAGISLPPSIFGLSAGYF
jgi:pilus assembly protein CpaF